MNDDNAVAVLGLGPMGQALAAATLAAGHRTLVWNRTPQKAADLVARGATSAPTVVDAARAGALLISCLLDYDAVRASLEGVHDVTLVNLSSGHSGQARAMAEWAAARGIDYLDGAILTPAPAIGTPATTILYGGPGPLFERCRPVLAAFGGRTVHLGDDPGRPAAYEMALLDLFAMAVGGLAHAFALAGAEGVAPADFARFAKGIAGILPEMADRFAEQLDDGAFPASTSSIASAASAIAHVRHAAEAHGIDSAALLAVQALIDRAVAAGHGGESYARLARLLSRSR